MLFGEAGPGSYPFIYTLPKNYSCDSSSTKSSSFTVSFSFGVRVVLKNATVISKTTAITLYREKVRETGEDQGVEDTEENKDD